MKAFETSAKVEDLGQVRIEDVPFAPGTEVEVTISPERRSAEEFTAAWERVCNQWRSSPSVQVLDDDEIQQEINRFRSGQ